MIWAYSHKPNPASLRQSAQSLAQSAGQLLVGLVLQPANTSEYSIVADLHRYNLIFESRFRQDSAYTLHVRKMTSKASGALLLVNFRQLQFSGSLALRGKGET